MLSGNSLDKAQEVRTLAAIAMSQKVGPELRAEIEASRAATANGTAPVVDINPLTAFDVPSLLHAGIIAWSYDASVSPHEIDDLDPVTRDWAAREIYTLCHSTEADRKNGSYVSTVPSMEMAKRRGNG